MDRCFALVTVVSALILSTIGNAQQAIILVRHAEKETNQQTLQGVADKDVPLSKAGKERAKALATHLKDAGIDAVYTSFAKRTQLTAEPLAKSIGKSPIVIARDTIKRLGERHADQIVLIVAHSGGSLGVPQLIDQITGQAQGIVIDDGDYDNLFMLLPKKDGTWSITRARYGAANPNRS
jgi:hypothetical protein